jgi:hypothetical protein
MRYSQCGGIGRRSAAMVLPEGVTPWAVAQN